MPNHGTRITMSNKTERRNPVARHGRRFNRAAVHRDRTRYTRKAKHKSREPFAVPAA
jgi:hypothetical protein